MTVDDLRVLFAHLTSCKPRELASCTIVHSVQETVFCAAGCSAIAMAMHVRLYILQKKQGEACMAFLPGCLTAKESACHVVPANTSLPTSFNKWHHRAHSARCPSAPTPTTAHSRRLHGPRTADGSPVSKRRPPPLTSHLFSNVVP